MYKQNIEPATDFKRATGSRCVWGIVLTLGLITARSHWIFNESFLGHNLFKEWWNLMRVAKIVTFALCFPCLLAWIFGRAQGIRFWRFGIAFLIIGYGLHNATIVTYYRYFGSLFPLARVRDVGLLIPICDQLARQILSPGDYLTLASTAALALWCGMERPRLDPPARSRRFRLVPMMALLSLLAYATLLATQIWRYGAPTAKLKKHGIVMTASHYGFLGAYAAITLRDATPPRIDIPHPGSINPGLQPVVPPFFIGLANVILLQVESLDADAINAEVAGRPVMPFLRNLARRSVHATHAYSQHAGGGSSDAELATLLSLLPLMSHSGLRTARYDSIRSLPGVLRQAGYSNYVMHSNNGHFFSRAFAYDKLPVDLFIDAKGFQENASGWYAKDEAFFMQALDHLAPPVQQPLCAYLITMQSHSPFRNHNIPHAFTLDFRGDGRYSTLEQHYLQAMHDVDSALASFLTALPERLETTNNLVVIFGDHSSGVLNRPAGKREPITLLFHHPDLEARKLRQPVSHLDVAPTISHLLGLPRGATWLGDDILAQGTRRVVLPNGAIVTWGPDSGTVHVLPGAGMPYVEYSTSLLQGGTP